MQFLKNNWRATLIGSSATFIGIGLERFAFTPLIPTLIAQDWFDNSEAAFLGAANLLGYLFGAISAKRISDRFGDARLIMVAVLFSALSFLLCAWPEPFSWFFLWRLISGITGGWLMVIGPSIAISHTKHEDRPVVGTLAFMGIGAGAVLSAVFIPPLLEVNLTVAWLVLGGMVVAVGMAAIAAASGLPSVKSIQPGRAPEITFAKLDRAPIIAVILVLIAYVGDAIGFVPHTVFWVDFLERDAGLPVEAANLQWALFGFGALLGPIAAGRVVSIVGWNKSLFGALLLKAVAVTLPFITVSLIARSFSSVVVGALVPGVVALTSGRIAELVGSENHKAFWAKATAAFALGQAASGYAMAEVLLLTGEYRPLFLISGLVLLISSISALSSHFVKAKT
ncbi:major facilitator family transporter [Salinisphaera sp. C84B14]|uniref:YbfB/YjiJ family MFS transporter n=1 Tax=Salinisphaera sp. C84B14 TaxID=1304155 RepID=UPI0033402F42